MVSVMFTSYKSLHAYCRKIATRFVIFAKDQKNKYAMTLSELLHSVSFDDLIPTLKEVYGVETDIYAYREAFDELNLLPAVRGVDQMRSI